MGPGSLETLGSSTTIGYKKLLRLPKTSTSKIRIVIEKSRDKAFISNLGLFNAPEILSDPEILRNKSGWVTIKTETPDPEIRYTLDGSDPTPSSPKYTGPFLLKEGGVVKARTFINDFKEQSEVVTKKFYLNQSKWKVTDFSDQHKSYPADNAIDGNEATMWHTHWGEKVIKHPHHITVDMGEIVEIEGFYYIPRKDDNKSGTIAKYSFGISTNGTKWKTIIPNGEFANIANNPIPQEVRFNQTYSARFFKFTSHEGAFDEDWVSVAEIGIINK